MEVKQKVLLFNIEGERRAAAEAVCKKLGMQAVAVSPDRCGSPVGSLVGIGGLPSLPKGRSERRFFGEMLLFYGLDSAQLDRFLEEYRMTGAAPVRLKAVMTPHNMSWSAAQLYEELEREDKAMRG